MIKFVGIGIHINDIYDQEKWKGQNLLGKALMEVRDYLQNDDLQNYLIVLYRCLYNILSSGLFILIILPIDCSYLSP